MPKTNTAQFYQLYFQEPGLVEAEFEEDVERAIRLMLFGGSGDAPPDGSGLGAMVPIGGRWLAGRKLPEVLPGWLSAAESLTGLFCFRGAATGLSKNAPSMLALRLLDS